MNRNMVFYLVGNIVKIEALLMLLPMFVSLYYRESAVYAFAIAIMVAMVIGFALTLIFKPKNTVIFAKEGFVVVALAWVVLSIIGSLPFYISQEIPNFIDALFETVSGFTTTGASILPDVESMSKGLLFWRSFTHWVGGMGVLIFVMAIMPKVTDRSIHIIRAEVPGPIVGKLVPKARNTAVILYLIYVGITIIEVIFLLFGGMTLFESVVHAFGTAGTGGFGIKADSIAGYSNYLQWVIAVFMLIFGINFNIYYIILLRKIKEAFKSAELWIYLSIIAIATALIAYDIFPRYQNISDSIRLSFFQVSSIITTTGYSTSNFDLWPSLSKGIIFVLTFIGGCAGSTAGGFKLSRVILMFKSIGSELKKMLHPRSVTCIKFEGKPVDKKTIDGLGIYLSIYAICLGLIFLFICHEPFGLDTNISAAVTCFNNVGPGFNVVGPMGSFAEYSGVSKIVLSFAMLLGRLEIFPMIFLFSPSAWMKSK